MINCSQLALCFYQIERIQKDIVEIRSSTAARRDMKQKTKKSFSSVVVQRGNTGGGAGNNNTSEDDDGEFEMPDPSASCQWCRNEIQSLKKRCHEQQNEIHDLRERCSKYEDDKNIHDQQHKKEEEECCPIDFRKEKQEQETSNMMVILNNKSKDDHQYNDSSINKRISSMEDHTRNRISVNEDDKKNDDIGHSEYIIPLDGDGDCDEMKGKTCALLRRSRWSFFSATRASGWLPGSTNTLCTTNSSTNDSLQNLYATKERRTQPKDYAQEDSSATSKQGVSLVGDDFCTDNETTTPIRSHIFYNQDDKCQKEQIFSADEVLNLKRKLRSREKEIKGLECFIGHNARMIDAMHLQIQNLKRFMK
jgi:hypothetical protein